MKDRTSAGAIGERVARLREQARTDTGLDAFGEDDYLASLRELLAGVGANEPLAEADAHIDAFLVAVLRSRLYSEAGWAARPQVRSRGLASPLVILGPPRTGTTILHNLLAQDPQFQFLEHWLIDQPLPRPPRETWSGYPGYRLAALRQGAEDQAQRQKHHVESDDPDECIRLMTQTFVSYMFGAMWPIATYDEWFLDQDLHPSFDRYADNLRLIGADDDRPWLLKNPNHVRSVDIVLDTWPDARIVQTHRDPTEQIPSICSLLAGRRRKLGASFEPLAIGRRELECWSVAVESAQRVREERNVAIFDAYYARLVEEPMEVVHACYEHFGMELRPEVLENMQRFLDDNPRGKHGAHVYDAGEYGLSAESIHEAFAPYIERHAPGLAARSTA
jgi:Sulfotransferase family